MRVLLICPVLDRRFHLCGFKTLHWLHQDHQVLTRQQNLFLGIPEMFHNTLLYIGLLSETFLAIFTANVTVNIYSCILTEEGVCKTSTFSPVAIILISSHISNLFYYIFNILIYYDV